MEFDNDYRIYRKSLISEVMSNMKDVDNYISKSIKYIVKLRRDIKNGVYMMDVSDRIMEYLSIRDLLILLDKDCKYKLPTVSLFQSKSEILIYKSLYSVCKECVDLLIIPQLRLRSVYNSLKVNLSVDFYCSIKGVGVVLEYDCEHHHDSKSYYHNKNTYRNDIIKDLYLIDNNISIIRIDSVSLNYVLKNISKILEMICVGKKLYYNFNSRIFLECENGENNLVGELKNMSMYKEDNIKKYYNNLNLLKSDLIERYSMSEKKLKDYDEVYNLYLERKEKLKRENIDRWYNGIKM